MSDLGVAATRETLVELTRLQGRLEALKCRVLDHGDILKIGTAPDEHGEAPTVPGSTAAWYAGELGLTRKKSRDALRLAKRLEDAFHATSRALAAGRVNPDQALVIVTAVDALPDFITEQTRREGEAFLLDRALEGHHAIALKDLGTKLLEVLDPAGLDEYLAKKLEAEEARAARRCFFEMHDDGQGTVRGRFAIPGLNADMLSAALNAIASPKRPDAIDRGDEDSPKPTAEVLGQAFCDYIERFPTDRLPVAGGINATVVVTMTLETLEGGLTPAVLDTGRLISAGEARRLASQCGVIPAVLGSRSEVLDLGRTVRLHTPAQRIALRLRHATTARSTGPASPPRTTATSPASSEPADDGPRPARAADDEDHLDAPTCRGLHRYGLARGATSPDLPRRDRRARGRGRPLGPATGGRLLDRGAGVSRHTGGGSDSYRTLLLAWSLLPGHRF